MKRFAKFFIEASILLGLFVISYLSVHLVAGNHLEPDGYFRREFRDTLIEISELEASGILAIHLALGIYLLRALFSRFHPPVNGIIYSALCFIAFFIALYKGAQFKAIYSLYQLNLLHEEIQVYPHPAENESALRDFLARLEAIPGKSEGVYFFYLYSFLIAAFLMLTASFIAYRMKSKKIESQN